MECLCTLGFEVKTKLIIGLVPFLFCATEREQYLTVILHLALNRK